VHRCDIGWRATITCSPTNICDKKGRNQRAARRQIPRANSPGFLVSPTIAFSVRGFLNSSNPAPNQHANELILSSKFDRPNLRKQVFRRGAGPHTFSKLPDDRSRGVPRPQIVDVCSQHSVDVAVERPISIFRAFCLPNATGKRLLRNPLR